MFSKSVLSRSSVFRQRTSPGYIQMHVPMYAFHPLHNFAVGQ